MQMSGPLNIDFNEDLYQCGKEACADGTNLREMLESASKMGGPNVYVDIASFAIGFADGLLELVRKLEPHRPMTRAELHQAGAELRPQRSDRPEEKIR